jgi:hypothetical protein
MNYGELQIMICLLFVNGAFIHKTEWGLSFSKKCEWGLSFTKKKNGHSKEALMRGSQSF